MNAEGMTIVEYALTLERKVRELERQLAKSKEECRRLAVLRIRDREIAAHYRALVEGVEDGFRVR